jgi:hypothetical protein
MQRNNCPIGEVVPALLILFEDLKRLQINDAPVTGTYASLRDLLIKSFLKKFEYELQSNLYLVSSLLLTSKLHMWYKRSFGKEYASKAISALVEITLLLKPLSIQKPNINEEITPVTPGSSSLFTQYSNIVSESDGENVSAFQFNYTDKIITEKNEFIKLLAEKDLTKIKSTRSFWESNKVLFSNISRIAVILFNITSNCAFVERFFSLSGIISNERRGNMSSELLIIRSMLCSNINLLEK